MVEESDIKALEGLKLTYTQARVYLAIVEIGDAKMSEISKVIGVARQDLYRAASELHSLGLVEKVLGKPIIHRAIPVEDAVAILRERIRKEYVVSQENAVRLAEKYKSRIPKTSVKTHRFSMIPMKEANIRKRQLCTEKCSKEICKISSQTNIPHKLFEEIMAALRRGVKIRQITERLSDIQKTNANLLQFKGTGNFEIRHLRSHQSIALTIFDENEALISTSAKAHIGEANVLLTNNSDLVKALRDYFEILWQKSIPY